MSNRCPKSVRRLAFIVLAGVGVVACDSPSANTGGNADAQEVSSLCPPDGRPEATQEATANGESWCLTVFEKKAFDLLATADPVGTGEACGLSPPSPFCFVKLVLSKPENGGVFGVSYEWYKRGSPPQRFEFETCSDTAGECEFDGHIGARPVKVDYDVGMKTLEITDSQLFLPYKLVDE